MSPSPRLETRSSENLSFQTSSRRGRTLRRMGRIRGDWNVISRRRKAGPVFTTSTSRVRTTVFFCLLSSLICISENYMLADPEWKMDIIPEIMDGKNIADFIDPDIAEKLEALEREEEKLAAEGFYDSDEDIVNILHHLFHHTSRLTSSIG